MVDCICCNLQHVLSAASVEFSSPELRSRLERYLYGVSSSRFRSFRYLAGPRPARHAFFREDEEEVTSTALPDQP